MIQFDKGLAERGIDVYMYDHTINKLPYNNPKFHWAKLGITGKSKENAQLKTLEHLIEKNGHKSEKNMILKIDIEHNEWDSLKEGEENVLNNLNIYPIFEFDFNGPNPKAKSEFNLNIMKLFDN